MVLENGQIRKDQYWDIDPNYSICYKTDQEYAERFLELFKEAIRARLRSHGPVGALLSGGLDSSSIVCTAQLLCQEKSIPNNALESFSVIFDTFPCDERSYINEVIRKWNIRSNYFTFEDNLDSVDFEQTAKFVDVGYFPTLFFFAPIYREARRKAIKAMLNGIGGDDFLAADYDHLTDLMLKGNFWKLMGQLRYDATLSSYSYPSLFFNYCLRPLIPQPVKFALRQLLTPFRGDGLPRWINGGFLKKIGLHTHSRKVVSKGQFPSYSSQLIHERLFHGWQANVALEMSERFSSFFGIESRSPFFDLHLVEFLLALPNEQRWFGERPKVVLRNAMRGILPEPIRLRKDKVEFSCTIDPEFKQRQVHKIQALLKKSFLGDLGIIDSSELQQLFQDYRKGVALDCNRNTLGTFIWLELWTQSFNGSERRVREW
jgi:asparagine synthase (glutamine-hydrolysing)